MKHYSIGEAVRISIKCADEYRRCLENRNYIFVYQDRQTKSIDFFETVFLPRNFMHLTGLHYTDEYIKELHLPAGSNGAVNFYGECLNRVIRAECLREKEDGTMSLKIAALPQLIHFLGKSNMTVVYKGRRPYLACDRLVGTVNYALGFLSTSDGYYVPDTCLNEDIRNFGMTSRVIAVFEKEVSAAQYEKIRYVAKKVDLEQIEFSSELKEKISLNNYRKGS